MNKRITAICVSIMPLIIALPLKAAVQTTPFQILGHIQNFCLDNQFNTWTNTCPKEAEPRAAIPAYSNANLFMGAKMVVNGVTVTIPTNTVVVMPATYLTPWQIFFKAQGVSKANNESGLALQDKVPPLAAFEVALDGNIVCNPTCNYIAGLVHISQQGLNMGAGFIRNINTSAGELCVGNDNTPVTTCVAPNARVQLNDPKINDTTDPAVNDGRYGRPNPPSPAAATGPNSRFPDPRFTVDQGNPTVHALTGYPMCIPRSGNDPKCPAGNRPAGLTTFVMGSDSLPPPLPGLAPIANCPKQAGKCQQDQQAPFVVGDYINYQGTLAKDGTGYYSSAHTVVANVGIYTEPHTDPAYVTQEMSLIGTMGPLASPSGRGTCATTMECQDRLKVEGFTTDPMVSSPTDKTPKPGARQLNIYALDVDLIADPTGTTQTIRRIATPATFKAVPLGRFKYILGQRAGVSVDDKEIQRGVTREIMVRIDTPPTPARNVMLPKVDPPKVANGLIPGQFTAPIGEYIFPEGLGLGDPQPKLNFQCLAFLTAGWALDVEDPINPAKQLKILPKQLAPWPDSGTPPTPAFDPPRTNPNTGKGVNCRN